MWTIFSAAGRAMANCDIEPDHEDLLSRDERAVFHEEKIALTEAVLVDGFVKRKPLVSLTADVSDSTATITIECEDTSMCEILLLISGVSVKKPLGSFIITGEPGVKLLIDFDREKFRGKALEVCF